MLNVYENFSVIIPTYHEAKNIPVLIKRFASINFNVKQFEVIIVDDNSNDGIVDIVKMLQDEYQWLKLIVRYNNKSLSQAVIEGINAARFPFIIVMDADLSHPPEKIKDMIAMLTNSNVDMVIGSRYIDGGSIDSIWPTMRKVASKGAAVIARILIGKNIRDPLSGFIGIRKEKIITGAMLLPIGWKISLEIMIKCDCRTIKEIPIHFAERQGGVSKMNLRVFIQYLLHIKRLALYKLFSVE